DLADVEIYQAEVIENYLPKQMSEDAVRKELTAIIATVGATSIADLGKVMGVATKQLAGKADGKIISGLVRELLTK
ncbi:MAG TPA: GatB/YqeY domain-containing protein, partial [Bacteroidia bacterium]|nr:GatB/YqeY domain-containing protein [Bacteroidia bacterium]